ncbi:hypothetical protein C1T15_29070, partial [Escherichia coli]
MARRVFVVQDSEARRLDGPHPGRAARVRRAGAVPAPHRRTAVPARRVPEHAEAARRLQRLVRHV